MIFKCPSLRFHWLFIQLILFVSFCLFSVDASDARSESTIAVGIVTNSTGAVISSSSGLTMIYASSRRHGSSRIAGSDKIELKPSQKGIEIRLNGRSIPTSTGSIKFVPARNSFVACNGRRYRGSLEVRLDSLGHLTCINTLPMEQYLYGVIASEMLISSPPEALRAQAVVARTFAYTYMDKFTRDGFNLSADTSCQVYGGYDTEDPRAIEAVDSTRGQVLMYGGNTISAVYTSVCGGHTENNEDVWEGAPKSYLRGVKCGFCSDSVKYAWDLTIDVKDFVGRLSLKGVTLSSLSGLRPVSWSTNGRVKLVSISHDGSDILISANELRRIIGYGDIKSTWFDIRVDNLTDNRYVPLSGTQKINRIREIFRKRRSIKPLSTGSSLASIKDISSPSPEPRQNPENFIRNIIRTSMSKKGEVLSSGASIKINGRGHGHGVGMCQWGAANMARQGWDFKKILQHYYTGVDFRVLR